MTLLLPEVVHRNRSIDATRGMLMVLMALDHIRDFLGSAHFDATDLTVTTPAIFFARWITHFCAPGFFFLSGMSAFASLHFSKRSRPQLARYLVTRGLLLIIVEQTLLRSLGWYFHFDYHFMNAGVLWALGFVMIFLAPLVFLNARSMTGIAIALIVVEAGLSSAGAKLPFILDFFLQSRDYELAGYHFFVSYPPLAWFPAMALGFGLTSYLLVEGTLVRSRIVPILILCLVLFLLLRAIGSGDPANWNRQAGALKTFLSLINVSKYPPSVAFLLLTIPGTLVALLVFHSLRVPVLEQFGRVPLFYYLAHIPLIHGMAVIYSFMYFGRADWLLSGPVIFWDVPLPGSPPEYGFGLPAIFGIWIGTNAILLYLCERYEKRVRLKAG
ncbi:MAG: heparan-alpha-glucosaminide N-acetyltransferase domain-containing protein [Spirochaetia bacterium]|nr:heparan-alpha-glucosaminide N-acetyltransferase domain-containing protein [Spirochaetia bacterium]